MNESIRLVVSSAAILLWGVICPALPNHSNAQEERIAELRELAFAKSVKRLQPVVVQIDIFSEVKPDLKTGTATLISANGEMVTSTYFVPSKATILTTLWGNKRRSIKLLAVDQSRGLALLKMDVTEPTPFVELRQAQCFVGQTTIAHGKTIAPSSTNISTGIVSALNRIWGKAIQTDAKISPANYGGPLTDLAGNTIGIITSLAPDGSSKGDAEWYDSGIGFAIPSLDVRKSIRRMRNNGDQFQGKTGIRFHSKNQLTGSPTVAQCFPRSPAANAGIQSNDVVVKVNDLNIATIGQFMQATLSFYSDETISVTIKRKDSLKNLKLKLARQLSVYKSPYLGIVPDKTHPGPGVRIGQIDESGPVKPIIPNGSVIEKLNGVDLKNGPDLVMQLSRFEANDKVTIDFRTGGKLNQETIKLDELIRAVTNKSFVFKKPQNKIELETEELQVSGFENIGQAWIPSEIPGDKILKCVVILAKSSKEGIGSFKRWQEFAEQDGHAFVVLFPAAIKGWQSDEKEFVTLALRKLYTRFEVPPKTYLVARDKTTPIGIDLFREQNQALAGIVLENPVWKQELMLPFATPGAPVFSMISVDKPFAIYGVKLQRSFLQNGIPSRLNVRSESDDDKNWSDRIRFWIGCTDRI